MSATARNQCNRTMESKSTLPRPAEHHIGEAVPDSTPSAALWRWSCWQPALFPYLRPLCSPPPPSPSHSQLYGAAATTKDAVFGSEGAFRSAHPRSHSCNDRQRRAGSYICPFFFCVHHYLSHRTWYRLMLRTPCRNIRMGYNLIMFMLSFEAFLRRAELVGMITCAKPIDIWRSLTRVHGGLLGFLG